MAAGTEQRANDLEMLFLRLRYKERRIRRVSSRDPLLLNDPQLIWLVYTGAVNVFWVPIKEQRVIGTRRFLFQSANMTALFGMAGAEFNYSCEVVGNPSAQLLEIPVTHLAELACDPEFTDVIAYLVDQWMVQLSEALFRDHLPRRYESIKRPSELTLQPGNVARAKDSVLWAISSVETPWSITFNDRRDLNVGQMPLALPLLPSTWLRVLEATRIRTALTAQLMRSRAADEPDLWNALAGFHILALAAIQTAAAQQDIAQRNQFESRQANETRQVSGALVHLASPLADSQREINRVVQSSAALLTACSTIGKALSIEVIAPDTTKNTAPTLSQIATASHFHIRKVALRGNWWTDDNGPLLAYWAEENAPKSPVALLPTTSGHYHLYDPVSGGAPVVVTAEIAERLYDFAYTFYRTFSNRPIKALELLTFSMFGVGREIVTIIGLSMLVGLLGLALPSASATIVDRIIPSAQHFQLFSVVTILLLVLFGVITFQIIVNITLLKVETRMDLALQTALLDRVLELPAAFFRQFTSGDLVMRLMSVNSIRQTLSGIVISSLMAGVFSLFSLGLLFSYSATLALIAVALTLSFIVVMQVIAREMLKRQRYVAEQQGYISGMLLGFLNGIAKFRIAAAEGRAFTQWAIAYASLRNMSFQTRIWSALLVVFNSVFPIITMIVIFASVVSLSRTELSIGGFIAFNVAFTQFVTAAMSLSTAYLTLIQLVPVYERAQPLLETAPEVSETKVDPGKLRGEISIQHVSFRYHENSPLVLDDISINISAGEFVAFVGPSGSGKSTMLRLLMGFEKPTAGKIYYDDQDLETLNLRAVRRQIGVVLQNGRLLDGSIFTNIVGTLPLTLNDAWEAARMAGIAEDISEMPMGMHTVVAGGGATISGGQRQRLHIARAIVNKPHLLFFDEATSSLDNQTQEIISKSIRELDATRIIIAHRLNTIVQADQIYVFENGHIVQQGTYPSLMKERGLFAELARRQLL